MFFLEKKPGRDFIVLNLSDPQLTDGDWDGGKAAVLRDTVGELVSRTSPDLITVSGDIACAGHMRSYENFTVLMDSCRIPWAPVWGNHDSQDGAAQADRQADLIMRSRYILFEKGDAALGCGNYTIAVRENGRIIYGIIMIDSHDRMPFTDPEGKTSDEWAHLIPDQLDWYRGQVEALGGVRTAVILHIPIYAYRTAFEAAWNGAYKPESVPVSESGAEKYWNEGYKGSLGVRYEGISSYPADEGMFDLIKKLGSTDTVLAGHDHVNNYIIRHEGVTLAFALKTGTGSYWNGELNGGTVLRISPKGAVPEHIFTTPAGPGKS